MQGNISLLDPDYGASAVPVEVAKHPRRLGGWTPQRTSELVLIRVFGTGHEVVLLVLCLCPKRREVVRWTVLKANIMLRKYISGLAVILQV